MTKEEMKKRIESQNKRKAEQDIAFLKRIKTWVPPIFQDVDPYPTFPSRDKEKNTNGVFLTGPIGTGKSHLAARLFLRWVVDDLGNGYGCIWWNVPKLLEEMRNEFIVPVSPTTVQKCLKAPILVLDDLGSEKSTDWTQDRISLIICDRYDEKKPTIITSNLSLKQIKKQDARITSRISCYYVNTMDNKDRRRI